MEYTSLQERFLNQLRTEKIQATFYLVNGFQIKGIIKSFDPYTILIASNGMEQLVFKHAVSTIAPWGAVNMSE